MFQEDLFSDSTNSITFDSENSTTYSIFKGATIRVKNKLIESMGYTYVFHKKKKMQQSGRALFEISKLSILKHYPDGRVVDVLAF